MWACGKIRADLCGEITEIEFEIFCQKLAKDAPDDFNTIATTLSKL